MPSTDSPTSLSLPSGWQPAVRSAILHVVSLAHMAIVHARGWAANSLNARVRQAAEIDELRAEASMLKEELRIKDARMAAILPHRRPHYGPLWRLAILELKAARGWSMTQLAKVFLIEPATVAAWLARRDEAGPAALVQTPGPVNRFPQFVRHIVLRLKTLCPSLGKVKLAQTLARAGLHLGATTVARMLKTKPSNPKSPDDSDSQEKDKPIRVVTAKWPNHVWHVDLTLVPTDGFWAPWPPFTLPQAWPFCWWVAAVVDHFSRRVMGVAIFRKQPNGRQVQQFLAGTIQENNATPKHIICDKGPQFWSKGFKRWCRRRAIRPRFGAVGKHGSIAVIERFIRSLKEECFRRSCVPLGQRRFRDQLSLYADWYNRFRPHAALGAKTPEERYRRVPSACRRPRYEPRPRWPVGSPCANPQAKVRGRPGTKLELAISWLDRQKCLPIVTLRRVA